MTKRLEYIDVMRGIAILLVVFEHCIGSLSAPLAGVILSFHMPLFFFISGSCAKPTCDLGGGKVLIIRRLQGVLIPQVTLGITFILTTLLFDVLLKHSITISDIDYISPFGIWFLPTLFLMDLIIVPIVSIIKSKKALLLAAILLFSLFCTISYKEIMYIQQALAASVFGLLGSVFRTLLDRYNESTSRFKGLGWLVILCVAIFSTMNDPIGMYINQYGNKLAFVVIALLGVYGILDISVSIKNSHFLQWCGRNSIIIYVLQFAFVRCSLAIVSRFEFTDFNYIWSFLVTMILLIPSTILCQKYCPIIFGKIKNK